MPAVAVVIPTFNRSRFLASCIDSVLGQTLPASQVLVVDDGSTDDTAEVLERYQGSVELVATSHGGKSRAVNAGLDRVRADYVWILDDDDIALPDALERFVEPLETTPELGFSYSTTRVCRIDPTTEAVDVIRTSTVPPGAAHDLLLALLRKNFLGGAAMCVRSSVYDEVGGFDPTLVRSQDYEMAIRIARRFRGVQVRGGPTFLYRQHDGVRGSLGEQFASSARREKWLEYDQRLFRRLREEIPLEELVPSGAGSGPASRTALLQRSVIMASKLLVDEALADIALAVEADDGHVLTPTESRAVRELLSSDAVHRRSCLLDERRAVDALRAISSDPGSPLAASIKRDLRRARAMRLWQRHAPSRLRRARTASVSWVLGRRRSAVDERRNDSVV